MADISTTRRLGRALRHFRLRKKVSGTPARPRLVVTRSSRHITAQIVDDLAGHTLASASTLDVSIRSISPAERGDKTAQARKVGELVAARAQEQGVASVVFDRGGNAYRGRVAALADAARESGLTF